MSGMAQISRADAAHFILDRINDPATIRKTLIVSQLIAWLSGDVRRACPAC